MAKASIESRCYCGGTFKHYIDNLHRCIACKRIWIRPSISEPLILMIPWKDFRESPVYNGNKAPTVCKRCGGATTLNTRTLRYKCNDKLCAYGWRDTRHETKSLMENRLQEAWRQLKHEMQDADDLEPYIEKLAINRAQQEALRNEEL